jgi:hypothetical protein
MVTEQNHRKYIRTNKFQIIYNFSYHSSGFHAFCISSSFRDCVSSIGRLPQSEIKQVEIKKHKTNKSQNEKKLWILFAMYKELMQMTSIVLKGV